MIGVKNHQKQFLLIHHRLHLISNLFTSPLKLVSICCLISVFVTIDIGDVELPCGIPSSTRGNILEVSWYRLIQFYNLVVIIRIDQTILDCLEVPNTLLHVRRP